VDERLENFQTKQSEISERKTIVVSGASLSLRLSPLIFTTLLGCCFQLQHGRCTRTRQPDPQYSDDDDAVRTFQTAADMSSAPGQTLIAVTKKLLDIHKYSID
jgi:hypothetical protein